MQAYRQAAYLMLDPWPLLGNNTFLSILTHVAAENNHLFLFLQGFYWAESRETFDGILLYLNLGPVKELVAKTFLKRCHKHNL